MTEVKRGSCLCGAVRFSVAGRIRGVGRCHCSLCRKAGGANGNAIVLVSNERFAWTSGEDHSRRFSLPSGWNVVRCITCGSPLPASHDGKHTWIHAGLMDDPLETNIKQHIFCGSRADWDTEDPDAREFDEYPTGGAATPRAK